MNFTPSFILTTHESLLPIFLSGRDKDKMRKVEGEQRTE